MHIWVMQEEPLPTLFTRQTVYCWFGGKVLLPSISHAVNRRRAWSKYGCAANVDCFTSEVGAALYVELVGLCTVHY
jgi:hypothetical protein